MLASGRVLVDAQPERLWEVLSDPEALAAALPSVSSIEHEGNRISAWVKPATSLGSTPLQLELELDRGEPGRRLTVSGLGRGGEYAFALDARFELTAEGAGTAVAWTAELRPAGVLSSVGQRVLPTVLAEQVDVVMQAASQGTV